MKWQISEGTYNNTKTMVLYIITMSKTNQLNNKAATMDSSFTGSCSYTRKTIQIANQSIHLPQPMTYWNAAHWTWLTVEPYRFWHEQSLILISKCKWTMNNNNYATVIRWLPENQSQKCTSDLQVHIWQCSRQFRDYSQDEDCIYFACQWSTVADQIVCS